MPGALFSHLKAHGEALPQGSGVDELFHALAAPGRRRLLDTLEHQRASAARAGDDPHRLTTDSTLRSMISHGRPELISGLTTLLETGEALPQH